MTNKKTPTQKVNHKSSYLGVAIVFFVAGIGLIIPEGTRISGIPFLILGFTFFTLSQDKSTKPKD